MKTSRIVFTLAALTLSAFAQDKVGKAPPPPTHANVGYGTHERQVLDFWKAES
jgi:hypothetical protein